MIPVAGKTSGIKIALYGYYCYYYYCYYYYCGSYYCYYYQRSLSVTVFQLQVSRTLRFAGRVCPCLLLRRKKPIRPIEWGTSYLPVTETSTSAMFYFNEN